MTVERLDPVNIPLNGVHLIEASAGTGKTYNITGLYVRLLLEENLRPAEILVVTYTEAACEELRDAIRHRLSRAYQECLYRQGVAAPKTASDTFLQNLLDTYRKQGEDFGLLASRLRLALTEFDLSAIYTIHGFCMRVLQDYAFESGFPFETEFIENDHELLQQIIDDYWEAQSSCWLPQFTVYLCQSGVFPETILARIVKLLKIVMVAGLESVGFSSVTDPSTLKAAEIECLSDLWVCHRETLMEMLTSSAALGRAEKTYRQDNLDRWFAELDRCFVTGVTPIPPISAIAMFSTSALVASARKGKADAVPRHEFFDQCQQITDGLVSAGNGLLQQLLRHCRHALQELKLQNGLLSFDDLLTGVRDALRHPDRGERFAAAIGRSYPVALIDEFQDTDPVQYEIFKTVYRQGHAKGLFLVGDPKQAIYGFRGADIFAYLTAARSNVDSIHSLTVNWRSEPGLIEACNCLFALKQTPPFIIPEIAFRPAAAPDIIGRTLRTNSDFKAPMTLAVFNDQPDNETAKEMIAHWLAGQIACMLDSSTAGKSEFVDQCDDGSIIQTELSAADIAILVRSHKEGELVKAALAEQGVSAVVQARESVFHSREAREVELLLEAVLEPSNERRLRAALATRLLGVTASGFAQLEDNELWEEWLQRFAEYRGIWFERGVAPMLYELFNKEKSFVRVSRLAGAERSLTNIRQLIELLQQAVHDQGLKPEMLLKWIKERRHEAGQSDATQIRLESDENLVRIITIHKSKGLQYPVVFCPFLWDSRLTNSKAPDSVVYHDDNDVLSVDCGTVNFKDNFLTQQKEELAEELRLLYVALTRAQHRCIIHWGRVFSRKKCRTATSALQYLLNRVAGRVELGRDVANDLQKFFMNISLDAWRKGFSALSAESNGCIEVVTVSAHQAVEASADTERLPLAPAKSFTRELNFRQSIHSFSSLHSHSGAFAAESPDHDSLSYDQILESTALVEKEKDMFAFPRGAKAGSCLHAILEGLDFQETDPVEIRNLVEHKLVSYGFEHWWTPVVTNFLSELVRVNFGDAGLSLNQISREKRLDEMEFYYQVPAIPERPLREAFYPDHSGQLLEHENTDSYLKGFIDLIFQWNDQFYIVDYKSNFLGDSYDDYQQQHLAPVMEHAGYDLQYRIYTIALHKYLSSRLPEYVYDTHFGGVYYLFLRGLSPLYGPGCGVYFARPGWLEMEQIAQQLNIGGNQYS